MRKTFVLFVAFACAALGQEFEVVSVKPNKSGSGSSHSHSDRGMLTASNLSLRSMIVRAYGVKDYQVEAPDWLSTARFDIAAKFPEALPQNGEKYNEALRAMMEKMLVERFKLAVHRTEKSFSVYALVVAKKGIKFKEVPDTGSNSNSNDTHFEGTPVSMARFAEFLSRQVEVPVLDMTGLKGAYEIKFDWIRDPRTAADAKSDLPVPADGPPGTNIPTALQDQLGLRLEARKAPIQILVIDHAERVPTEN